MARGESSAGHGRDPRRRARPPVRQNRALPSGRANRAAAPPPRQSRAQPPARDTWSQADARQSRALAARRRLAAHIAASKHARTQRTVALVTSALSAVVLLTAGSGWLLAGYVSSHVGRVNAGTPGTPDSGPLNILLAGVDVRSGLSRHEQRILHVGHATGHNSDTLMVVHITGDHRHIQVVSLPRDSWVRIPGFGMNKINAAFGIGGPRLMVRTVQQATGLTINDFVEVNFLGFVKIIDALGGVDICLPYAVNDPYSGLHMSAGRHHVNGLKPLKFARD
ncbi:MAG: LCP family protein, partial [Streptosporangiaceae bacterium]